MNLSRKDISLRLYIVVGGGASQGVGYGAVLGVFFTADEAHQCRKNDGFETDAVEIWDCQDGKWTEHRPDQEP